MLNSNPLGKAGNDAEKQNKIQQREPSETP
jgi:hypothetical protein